MPVFDYQCNNCGHVFESINTRPDDDDECPECWASASRIAHTFQNLKKPYYVPPPKASRKWGDEKPTAHRPARWV